MNKTSPWHSPNGSVHHNDPNCSEGQKVKPEDRQQGTGGLPLCPECRNLPKTW